jgi:STE24 endopeptidase
MVEGSAGMEENSARAKQYSRIRTRLVIVQLVLTAVFLLVMLFSGASSALSEVVTSRVGNFHLQVALYLAAFGVIYYFVFLGLDFYGEFLLEHKFSLSNQTVPEWLKRSVKRGLLSFLVLLILVEALYFSLRHFPEHWWLLATGAWVILTVVLGKIAPALIIPLFYKCVPLGNKELKERLLGLGGRCGVEVSEVFEIRLSAETRKANAAVAGLGKSRRILLGDTILKDYSDEEIEAVFAHELGHIRLGHIRKILCFGAAASLLGFYLSFLLYKWEADSLGLEVIHDMAAFPLLALILMALGLVLVPMQLWYLRHLERQADMFAVEHIEEPESFGSAIRKLAKQNLIDASPSRLEEVLLYDHPPVSKRLGYVAGEND